MTTQPETSQLLFLKDKNKALFDLIRFLSEQRFSDISGRPIVAVKDHETPDDFVYGSHQTVIQIASRDLRVTFKSHFKLEDARRLTDRKKALERSSKQVQKSTYDLFMEYSNLVAGGISQHLHSNGIVAGISLPMATSGFDELISSDSIKPTSYFDYWRVVAEDFNFTCTVCVDILNEQRLSTLSFERPEPSAVDDSGLEIL
jgi:hypothetical protein